MSAMLCMCGFLAWQFVGIRTEQANMMLQMTQQQALLSNNIYSGSSQNAMIDTSQFAVMSPSVTSTTDDVRIGTLAERMNELEVLISKLSQENAQLRDNDDYEIDLENLPTDVIASSEQKQTEETQIKEDRLALMETRMSDTRDDDSVWSTGTTVMIEEKFAQNPALNLAEPTLIDCAATICKIETIISPEADAFQKQEIQWNLLMAFNEELTSSTFQTINQEDGSQKLLLYMGRDGYSLSAQETASR